MGNLLLNSPVNLKCFKKIKSIKKLISFKVLKYVMQKRNGTSGRKSLSILRFVIIYSYVINAVLDVYTFKFLFILDTCEY